MDCAITLVFWRDATQGAGSWRIDVTFADGPDALHMASNGSGWRPARSTRAAFALYTWIGLRTSIRYAAADSKLITALSMSALEKLPVRCTINPVTVGASAAPR